MKKDVEILIEIWEELHEIGGKLDDIERRHPKIQHLQDNLENSKAILIEIAHVLFAEAHALEREIEDEKQDE